MNVEADTYRSWTEALAAVAPVTWTPPPADDALLDRLGVPPGERAELRAALVSLDRDPGYRWLLERATGRLLAAMGDAAPFDPGAVLGPGGAWFHVAVFLACLPKVREHHRGLGIPDDVSWASLAELGNKIDVQRRLTGTGGCRQYMVQLAFRGILYWLGRLQFNLTYHPDGTPGVAVHIPETGRLSPPACEASYLRAAGFFARHFPAFASDGRLVMSCSSWLLDPQLARYLPADANILRFQRGYTVTDAGPEPPDGTGLTAGDRSIAEFVFRQALPDLDGIGALRPRTTLERAIVTHLRAGHHWQVRDGLLYRTLPPQHLEPS